MRDSTRTGDGLAWLAGTLVVALFCVMLAGYYVPAYEGTDENGYLCSAKRMALSADSAKHTSHPLEYVSENVVQVGDTVFYAKYPLGYPWLCALAIRLGGESAAFLVNPILAVLAVVGIFLLARAMFNSFAGVLAAVLLATNPLHASFALSALSHTGAICFAIWSMVFLWRWVQDGGWGNAFAAGGLAACAYTVRYTEALLVFPLAAMAFWRYFSLSEDASPTEHVTVVRRWQRDAGMMAAGILVFALPLLIHHWIAFGRPWRTGYDLCGESTGFGWKWFQENWWLTIARLNTPGLLLIFPLGLAGWAYLATHDLKRGLLLILWGVPALLLYTAYYWAPQGDGRSYIRFFVSVFPAFILGALALLSAVKHPGWVWAAALGVFVAIVATVNLRQTILDLENQQEHLLQVQRTWDIVRSHVPDSSILVASGSALNNLEFIGNYEMYSSETFNCQAIKNRIKILEDHDPHPFQRDKARALARAVGDMSDDQLAKMQRSLLATNVAAGRTVMLVCTSDQFHNIRGRLGEAFNYEREAEWLQVNNPPNSKAPTQVTWDLYRLQPPRDQAHPTETLTSVETRIDLLQFRVKTMHDDFEQRYPGASQTQNSINDAERQLKELREQAKRLAKQKKPSPPVAAAGALATNSQPSLTSAVGMTNLTTTAAGPAAWKAQ